jgi:hypothetical protein
MDILLIWVNREAVYFWKPVWTGRIALILFSKLVFMRTLLLRQSINSAKLFLYLLNAFYTQRMAQPLSRIHHHRPTGLVGTTRHDCNRKAMRAFWRSRLYLSGIPAEIVSSLPVRTPHRRQIGICSAASSEKTAGTHAWHLCCWLGS